MPCLWEEVNKLMAQYPIVPVTKPRREKKMIDKRGREISEESRKLMGGIGRFKPKHGLRNSVEYRIWGDMLNRCRNVKRRSFKNYGGRGILVCDRWKKFENFILDVGLRPSIHYGIDRINVNGNYEPENVQWNLKFNQQRNTTKNVRIPYKGELYILEDVARKIGIILYSIIL